MNEQNVLIEYLLVQIAWGEDQSNLNVLATQGWRVQQFALTATLPAVPVLLLVRETQAPSEGVPA